MSGVALKVLVRKSSSSKSSSIDKICPSPWEDTWCSEIYGMVRDKNVVVGEI